MSKQLYDEAIADIRKIREVAENDAKLAIVEAVTPRIRELIENELLAEASNDERCDADDEGEKDCEVLTDVVEGSTDECSTESMPNEATEDPMRVDLDVAREACDMEESVGLLKRASSVLRSTSAFSENVSQLILRVENMYESVQGSQAKDAAVLEQRLECLYKALNELQETTEMVKSRKRLNEEDVTVRLTGLPDDVDLENIGVDLIAGDEEVDAMAADADAEGDVDATTSGEDEDLDLSSLGGDDEAPVEDEEDELETEAMDLSDDTVVEIDEGMLRREIKKLRALREAASCDDFGGGRSEGDPWLDATVDQEDGEGTVTVAEAHDDDEVDVDLSDLDDDDEVDVDLSDIEGPSGFDPDSDFDDVVDFEGRFELDPKQFESVERKLELETRLLARAKVRSASIREQLGECKHPARAKQLRAALTEQSKRVVESTRRVEKIKSLKMALEGNTRKPVSEARSNRASRPAAEGAGEKKLREQLAETNLQNVKLRCANKLLQNEGLSARQKAQVLERLNEAKNAREATLLYNGIVKTLATRPIRESNDRRVIGSGSRPTGSGSPRPEALTESRGTEIGDLDRWAKMAGLTK